MYFVFGYICCLRGSILESRVEFIEKFAGEIMLYRWSKFVYHSVETEG